MANRKHRRGIDKARKTEFVVRVCGAKVAGEILHTALFSGLFGFPLLGGVILGEGLGLRILCLIAFLYFATLLKDALDRRRETGRVLLKLTSDGLAFGERKYQWDEIEGATLEHGRPSIKLNLGQKVVDCLRARDLPDQSLDKVLSEIERRIS